MRQVGRLSYPLACENILKDLNSNYSWFLSSLHDCSPSNHESIISRVGNGHGETSCTFSNLAASNSETLSDIQWKVSF